MLIEWPDRFYHTTGDVLANIDAQTLQRNGIVALAYVLFLANAGRSAADWLECQATGQFVAELGRLQATLLDSSPHSLPGLLRYRVDRQQECLEWLDCLRLQARDTVSAAGRAPAATQPGAGDAGPVRRGGHLLEQLATSLGAAPPGTEPPDGTEDRLGSAGAWILERVYNGPISHFAHMGTLPADEQDDLHALNAKHAWAARTYFRHLTQWMDGAHTLREIANRLAAQFGRRDDAFLPPFVTALEHMGLIRVRRPEQ
jgi:hypothetical protein